MQVQQTLSNHQSSSKGSIKVIPATVAEFFESQQYKLATSGFSTPAISMLINNPNLHQKLIDTMLLIDQPEQINIRMHGNTEIQSFNQPFKVFQLLKNFEDVYPNYMFGFNGGVELENNGRKLLVRMFEIFQTKEPVDETAIGYLYRIVEEVFTKTDTVHFFRFIHSRPNILQAISHHLDSPAVSGMIFRSLQIGNQQIPSSEKIEVIRRIFFGCVNNIQNKLVYNQYPLEGLKYVAQKILDRGSIRKIGSNHLSEYLLSKQISELLCGILNKQNYSNQVYESCFEIILILLKQFKENQAPSAKPRTSMNKSANFFKNQNKPKQNQLSLDSIELLVSTISKYIQPLIMRPINQIPSKKYLNVIFMQVVQLMALYISKQLKPLLSLKFQVWILQNMINVPQCNMYHTSAKQIINLVVADQQLFSTLVTTQTLSQIKQDKKSINKIEQFNFIQFLFNYFIKNTQIHCFGTHLYEIIDTIYKKVDEDKLNQLLSTEYKQQQWKQILNKYQQIKLNRIRKYEDANDSDVDQEQIRVRAKSIGSDNAIPLEKADSNKKINQTKTQPELISVLDPQIVKCLSFSSTTSIGNSQQISPINTQIPPNNNELQK